MIKAKHHPVVTKIFDWYIPFQVRKHFNDIRIEGIEEIPKNASILLLANHFSWWDGHFIYLLNRIYFKKKFHVLMLEETLLENPILNQIGAFSVQKKSRDVFASLAYCNEVLIDPTHLLAFFPQGKIESQFVPKIKFEKGINRIIKGLSDGQCIAFAANFTFYGSSKKPNLSIFLKSFEKTALTNYKSIEEVYSLFYEKSKNKLNECDVLV